MREFCSMEARRSWPPWLCFVWENVQSKVLISLVVSLLSWSSEPGLELDISGLTSLSIWRNLSRNHKLNTIQCGRNTASPRLLTPASTPLYPQPPKKASHFLNDSKEGSGFLCLDKMPRMQNIQQSRFTYTSIPATLNQLSLSDLNTAQKLKYMSKWVMCRSWLVACLFCPNSASAWHEWRRVHHCSGWSNSGLTLPSPAPSSYRGASHGIHTPTRQGVAR